MVRVIKGIRDAGVDAIISIDTRKAGRNHGLDHFLATKDATETLVVSIQKRTLATRINHQTILLLGCFLLHCSWVGWLLVDISQASVAKAAIEAGAVSWTFTFRFFSAFFGGQTVGFFGHFELPSC